MDKMKKDLEENTDQKLNELTREYDERIQKLEGTVKEQRMKMHLLGELLCQRHQVTSDLGKRLDSIELCNARRSIVLTGITLNQKKQARTDEIQQFFKDVFDISPVIEDSYLIGKRTPRPAVITLDTYRDKSIIMNNKSILKQYQGEKGRSIFINDYVPQNLSEKKKRERDIIRTAKAENVSAEYTNQGLKVGEELYKKMVEAPNPCDIMDLDLEDIDRILSP